MNEQKNGMWERERERAKYGKNRNKAKYTKTTKYKHKHHHMGDCEYIAHMLCAYIFK